MMTEFIFLFERSLQTCFVFSHQFQFTCRSSDSFLRRRTIIISLTMCLFPHNSLLWLVQPLICRSPSPPAAPRLMAFCASASRASHPPAALRLINCTGIAAPLAWKRKLEGERGVFSHLWWSSRAPPQPAPVCSTHTPAKHLHIYMLLLFLCNKTRTLLLEYTGLHRKCTSNEGNSRDSGTQGIIVYGCYFCWMS